MYNERKVIILKVLTLSIAVSAMIASSIGLIFTDIYKRIVSDSELAFIFAQDLISLISSVILLVLSVFPGKKHVKWEVIRIGLIGYLLYVFGQYVMGTVYNYCYFLYLTVFGLSIFFLMAALSDIKYENIEFDIPGSLRIIIAIYCTIIPAFFAPQWIVEIYQHIRNGLRPGSAGLTFNYYVYILDLCFVLPVCVLSVVFILQKKKSGILLGGILSIFGFALMLWVALGFWFKNLFHQQTDVGNTILFSVISLIFFVLSIFYFVKTKIMITGKV
jgi:hypothetical protein